MVIDPSKTYLIDLDGTMYKGSQVIPEAITFIQYLQEHHISYVFVTNNAMRTPAQIRIKMEHMGFTNLQDEDFFTSAMASVSYMKKHHQAKRVFYIGEEGLAQAIQAAGYEIDETHAELVFVGLDRHADFSLYSKVLRLLYEEGAMLVGTNQDRRLPDQASYLIGNGAIIEMLKYASEAPSITIGKPSQMMMEETLAYVQKSQSDCVVIGDNLETDIAFAIDNQVPAIMVCTGVHTKLDAQHFRVQPDVIVSSLSELYIK